MSTTESTTDDRLRAIRDDLQSRHDLLATELEGLKLDLSAATRALELLGEFGLSQGRAVENRAVTVEDVQDCKTQRDLAKRYAHLVGGVVRLEDVCELTYATGKWTSKKKSLRSTLYNYVSKSREWEWVEPGVFRLLEVEQPVAKSLNGHHPAKT